MSATPPQSRPQPPIVTLGPCGSGFLSVDRSIEEALDHLDEHRSNGDGPRRSELSLFDAHARPLALGSGRSRRLTVSEQRPREGELRARITETFAHARERLYREPDLLRETGARDPERCRPPSDELDLSDYLATLSYTVAAQTPPDAHVGSWWHNLFHRLR